MKGKGSVVHRMALRPSAERETMRTLERRKRWQTSMRWFFLFV